MKFTDNEFCTNRLNCWFCRNDEQFRSVHESVYGPWECPLGLTLNCLNNGLPEAAVHNHNDIIIARREADKIRIDAMVALEELTMVANKHMLDALTKLRLFAFPETKSASRCKFGSNEIVGQVEEECCGGKIELVHQYPCALRGKATPKVCQHCTEFFSK